MNKKILITGVDGFVGKSIKQYFTNQGFDVYGTTFFEEPQNEKEIRFNITKKDEYSKLWKDEEFEIVIHSVGLVDQTKPYDMLYAVNTLGTKYFCEYAKTLNCKHLLFTSSVSVYGMQVMGENRTEKNTTRKTKGFLIPPYAITKAMAEEEIEACGLDYTIIRLPIVLGANDTFITPSIVPRLLNGTMFTCGKKPVKCSVLYVENLGPILEKIISVGPLKDAFNCIAHDIYWDDFVKEFAKNLGVDYKPIKKSFILAVAKGKDKTHQFIASYSSRGSQQPSGFLQEKLNNWTPPFDWKDGVKDAVNAYKEKNA